jgi:hypothetical protein
MSEKIVNCLYSHFKNTSKKLKIVCDWDEVIQPHEPYAFWQALTKNNEQNFPEFFKMFWEQVNKPVDKDKEENKNNFTVQIDYSPYGSKLEIIGNPELTEKVKNIKNSPNFYQQAPFLTLARELLKLIKEDKIEKIIFLSAYDKRVFSNGDERKKRIFSETFGKFSNCALNLIAFNSELPSNILVLQSKNDENQKLQKVSNPQQVQTKSEWIKENVPDGEIVIDDNPNILVDILKSNDRRLLTFDRRLDNSDKLSDKGNDQIIAVAPFYSNIKHHEKVLLIKTSVSDLKKENFL